MLENATRICNASYGVMFFREAKASVLPQHTTFHVALPKNNNESRSLNRFRLIHSLDSPRQKLEFTFPMLGPKRPTSGAWW